MIDCVVDSVLPRHLLSQIDKTASLLLDTHKNHQRTAIAASRLIISLQSRIIGSCVDDAGNCNVTQ